MESQHQRQQDYTSEQKLALIQSATTLLLNKIKLLVQNPQKNRQLALNNQMVNLLELICEHLVPLYMVVNFKNSSKISQMHSLCFLLAQKVQAVFTAGVIRTCIDQNWDLKGYKAVVLRILQLVGFEDTKKLQEFFDKMIQSQNLQSQSCIKAISQFLRSRTRQIDEDDLKNPIVSFQTSFGFVKREIEKFRSQNMPYTCFTILHPWAYDLDQVDFKYVINKDQTQNVCEGLKESIEAQVFWLSFFKSHLSVSADEFFEAIKEVCILNHIPEYFDYHFSSYKQFMHSNNFQVSLKDDAVQIVEFISSMNKYIDSNKPFNVMRDQIRTKEELRTKTDFVDETVLRSLPAVTATTQFPSVFGQVLPALAKSKSYEMTAELVKTQLDLKRQTFEIKPAQKQTHNLFLKFTNVDTEELKDLELKFDGNFSQFKVGEGDLNHYIITNDKKLWESQVMILNKGGQFYVRDLGVVHTSRIKVTAQTQLQIHQGALLDLGKVVHYHVDKLLHMETPTIESNAGFVVMKEAQAQYKLDDEAMFRARPTWVSADENKDLVQNEIILEPTSKKSSFSVGRSNRRDVEIKLKAVSADHCKIEYRKDAGWFVHEKEKDRLSSNGTFVFMKSLQQMDDHEPSDVIPLFNGMTISFINYELQVRIEPKSQEELANSLFEEVKPFQTPQPSSSRTQPQPPALTRQSNVSQHSSHQQNDHIEDTHSVKSQQHSEKLNKHQEQDMTKGGSQVEVVPHHEPEITPQHHIQQQEEEKLQDTFNVKTGHQLSEQMLANQHNDVQSQHSHRSQKSIQQDTHSQQQEHHHHQEEQHSHYENNEHLHAEERRQSQMSNRSSAVKESVHQSLHDEQVHDQHHQELEQLSSHRSVKSNKSIQQSSEKKPDHHLVQQEDHLDQNVEQHLQQDEAENQSPIKHHQSDANQHQDQEEEKSVHQDPVQQQNDISPKQVVRQAHDEEEQQLMRSYSRHNIGEGQEKSIRVSDEQHQHENNNEHAEQSHSNHQDQQEQAEHHEELIQSQRSEMHPSLQPHAHQFLLEVEQKTPVEVHDHDIQGQPGTSQHEQDNQSHRSSSQISASKQPEQKVKNNVPEQKQHDNEEEVKNHHVEQSSPAQQVDSIHQQKQHQQQDDHQEKSHIQEVAHQEVQNQENNHQEQEHDTVSHHSHQQQVEEQKTPVETSHNHDHQSESQHHQDQAQDHSHHQNEQSHQPSYQAEHVTQHHQEQAHTQQEEPPVKDAHHEQAPEIQAQQESTHQHHEQEHHQEQSQDVNHE